MKRYQIFWAMRYKGGKNHGELKSFGGVTPTGEIWNLSLDQAIEKIQNENWNFFIVENQLEIPVRLASLYDSDYYLTSTGKGYIYNLLDELPEYSFLQAI